MRYTLRTGAGYLLFVRDSQSIDEFWQFVSQLTLPFEHDMIIVDESSQILGLIKSKGLVWSLSRREGNRDSVKGPKGTKIIGDRDGDL